MGPWVLFTVRVLPTVRARFSLPHRRPDPPTCSDGDTGPLEDGGTGLPSTEGQCFQDDPHRSIRHRRRGCRGGRTPVLTGPRKTPTRRPTAGKDTPTPFQEPGRRVSESFGPNRDPDVLWESSCGGRTNPRPCGDVSGTDDSTPGSSANRSFPEDSPFWGACGVRYGGWRRLAGLSLYGRCGPSDRTSGPSDNRTGDRETPSRTSRLLERPPTIIGGELGSGAPTRVSTRLGSV